MKLILGGGYRKAVEGAMYDVLILWRRAYHS